MTLHQNLKRTESDSLPRIRNSREGFLTQYSSDAGKPERIDSQVTYIFSYLGRIGVPICVYDAKVLGYLILFNWTRILLWSEPLLPRPRALSSRHREAIHLFQLCFDDVTSSKISCKKYNEYTRRWEDEKKNGISYTVYFSRRFFFFFFLHIICVRDILLKFFCLNSNYTASVFIITIIFFLSFSLLMRKVIFLFAAMFYNLTDSVWPHRLSFNRQLFRVWCLAG